MATPLQSPFAQFFDSDGNPLSGGKLYSYVAGTTTPKDTYTDAGGLTPAANPVILDSSGRAAIWLTGTYRFDLYTSNDVLVRSVDQVPAFTAGGDMTKAVYDPANIASQVAGVLDIKAAAGGRLTLTTAVPVTTADVTGATTIYYTPYKGNQISLYTGNAWVSHIFTEFSLALGTLTSGLPYDVFLDYNDGTPQLAMTAWTNDTTRATALTYQDGVLVKTGDTQQRYLGTFYTTSTTQTEDSLTSRYVWNMYNRVDRPMRRIDSTSSWNYTTATWRQAGADTDNELRFVRGLNEDAMLANLIQCASNTSAGVGVFGSIGLDSTTAPSSESSIAPIFVPGANYRVVLNNIYSGFPGLGKHRLVWLELSQATGTTTWDGDAASPARSMLSSTVRA